MHNSFKSSRLGLRLSWLIVGVCWAISVAVTGPNLQAISINEHWENLRAGLDDALALLNRQREAPDKSWVPFREDKQSLELEIEAILDEAIEILNISELSEIKQQIRQSQSRIRDCRKRISELQMKQLLAPEEIADWKIWSKDAADYEEEIQSYRDVIAKNEARIQSLKNDFHKKIQKIGIDFDQENVDTLIHSVTGDDDVRMIAVFDNIKQLTVKLRELTRESHENIETARRYYGMHLVLLKTLLRLQTDYVHKINHKYLPALEAVAKDNRRLIHQTESLLEGCPPNHKTQYEANLDAQRLTDKTVRLYTEYLRQNEERVTHSRQQLMREFELAENTYLTVSTAYSLIDVMRNAESFFSSLSALQTPELLVFDNTAMKEEFKKLSAKMAGH